MDVEIGPSRIRGAAGAPPSKSYTHRAILAAGYADGASIEDPLWSADTRATARAVEAFGGAVARPGDGGAEPPVGEDLDRTLATADESTVGAAPDGLDVAGFAGSPAVPDDVLDCANSGTTMRLTTATAVIADGLTVLTGDDSLRSRPQRPLLDAIEQLGGRAESTRGNGQAPLVVGGPDGGTVGGPDGGTVGGPDGETIGGTASIPGDVSSQFVTALLMAGAVTDVGVEIDLETQLKSAPYVDVTIEVLADFGVEARETAAGYAVDGGQTYDPAGGTYAVPGDFSSTSYLLAAGAVAAPEGIEIRGARPSAQGDSAIVDVLERMGADLDWDREEGVIEVAQAALSGIEVGVSDTPDLLPTIAVLGAVADGTTRIVDAEHVRYKETDRVAAMAEGLGRLGASVTEHEDELHVHGGESDLQGATVDGRADHRVIMSLAVAGLVADGTTTVAGAEHVDVSFPGFFDVLYDLGADVTRRA